MFDIMQGFGQRIALLLAADGGHLFPAPGDRVTAVPQVYYRDYPPRQRDPSNPECIPGVIVFRQKVQLGFAPKEVVFGVLWELYHPPYEGPDNSDYYKLGEENLDRVDDFMVAVLKQGRAIGDWDMAGVAVGEYGASGTQLENTSAVLYKITAKKTRG